MIKKGDRIQFKPEWQDAGDSNVTFIAVEDESGGRVMISAEIGLPINPTQIVHTYMIQESK